MGIQLEREKASKSVLVPLAGGKGARCLPLESVSESALEGRGGMSHRVLASVWREQERDVRFDF